MASTRSAQEAVVLQGYTVVQVKGGQRSHACHCLYLRPHSSTASATDWPEGRTVILYNVPAYCKEENIRLVFQECGDIDRVYLQSKPSGVPLKSKPWCDQEVQKCVQVAYVVFKKSNGAKNACSLPFNKIQYLSNQDVSILSGLRAYCEDYSQIPDVAAMEKEAEDYMAQYYTLKEEELKKEKKMGGVPDEEGFIKVTRHGKNRGTKRTEETEKKGHEHIRKRKTQNELKDFYTFQFRESKKKHILDLQAKFEEDKKRVRAMRVARTFKPFQ